MIVSQNVPPGQYIRRSRLFVPVFQRNTLWIDEHRQLSPAFQRNALCSYIPMMIQLSHKMSLRDKTYVAHGCSSRVQAEHLMGRKALRMVICVPYASAEACASVLRG